MADSAAVESFSKALKDLERLAVIRSKLASDEIGMLDDIVDGSFETMITTAQGCQRLDTLHEYLQRVVAWRDNLQWAVNYPYPGAGDSKAVLAGKSKTLVASVMSSMASLSKKQSEEKLSPSVTSVFEIMSCRSQSTSWQDEGLQLELHTLFNGVSCSLCGGSIYERSLFSSGVTTDALVVVVSSKANPHTVRLMPVTPNFDDSQSFEVEFSGTDDAKDFVGKLSGSKFIKVERP